MNSCDRHRRRLIGAAGLQPRRARYGQEAAISRPAARLPRQRADDTDRRIAGVLPHMGTWPALAVPTGMPVTPVLMVTAAWPTRWAVAVGSPAATEAARAGDWRKKFVQPAFQAPGMKVCRHQKAFLAAAVDDAEQPFLVAFIWRNPGRG